MSIVSMITIGQATNSQHTGKYECAPDNIKPAYINLHVITGTYVGHGYTGFSSYKKEKLDPKFRPNFISKKT